jgi:hypothetical protein
MSFPTVPCKDETCTIPIIFALGPNGSLPLDSRAPVYRVEEQNGILVAIRVVDCFVLHHATCKNPGRFSGKKKPTGGPT